MLSTTDKTVIDRTSKNDSGLMITKSIIIGYNGDTSIYTFKIFNILFDILSALNNMSWEVNWLYGDICDCSYEFTKCSSANYSQRSGVRICSACYEYYKSATKISKSEYDTYIRDISLVNTTQELNNAVLTGLIAQPLQGELPQERQASARKFISGFTKNNKYFISLKTHKMDNFIRIYEKDGELTSEEKYEVNRRKFTQRLLMFAKCDLIKDIIRLIALMLIG